MRLVVLMSIAVIAPACTGCFSARPSTSESFTHIAARNSVQQSIRYHDEHKFVEVVKRQAEQSLAQCPGKTNKAFGEGYIDGFIDYVEAGGDGEPPFLPPFRYRTTHHRTPEGHQLIQDWYAGFRQGAQAAKASGLREHNLVPLPQSPASADALSKKPSKAPASAASNRSILPDFELVTPLPPLVPLSPEPLAPEPKLPMPAEVVSTDGAGFASERPVTPAEQGPSLSGPAATLKVPVASKGPG